MNKLLWFGFVFLLLPFNNIFGTTQTNLGDNPFIFVQTTVRNSDGIIIVYLESTKFTNLNLPALKSFLDYEASRGNDPIITIDDQKYQVIRRAQSMTLDSETLQASTILSDNVNGTSTLLARFAHDGYTTVPGDTSESIWTFVRPIS